MKLHILYTMILSEIEAIALKKLLGNFTDIEKTAAGLNKEEIQLTREIWNILPDEADND